MSSEEGFLFNQLRLLNTVFSNAIQPSQVSHLYSQFADMSGGMTLFENQKLLVAGMIAYHRKMANGYVHDRQIINGKVGIIGDEKGSGKTVSVLTYLRYVCSIATISPVSTLVENSNCHFYSQYIPQSPQIGGNYIKCNLIIVPPRLYSMWKDHIKKIMPDDIHVLYIENKHALNKVKKDELYTTDIILTTGKCFKQITHHREMSEIIWNQVVIDDAYTIYIPGYKLKHMRCNFMWLITDCWYPYIILNPEFRINSLAHITNRLERIHPDFEMWLEERKDKYMFHTLFHKCTYDIIPIHHPAIHQVVLLTSRASKSDIYDITPFTKSHITYNPYVGRFISSLRFHRILQKNPEKSKKLLMLLQIKLASPRQLCEEFPHRASIIENKVHDTCTICFEDDIMEAHGKIMLTCCNHIFCGKCILQQCNTSDICPICRTDNLQSNMRLLFDNDEQMTEYVQESNINGITQKSKQELLTEYLLRELNRASSSKILIYITCEGIFVQYIATIVSELRRQNIKTSYVTNAHHISSMYNGNAQIVFISDVDFIQGMNLTHITHLIFYNEPEMYEIRSVLESCCQRQGRKAPLQILEFQPVSL